MEAAMRDSFNRAMMESSLQHYRGNSTASDPSSQGFKAPGIPPYVGFASPFGLGAQEQHQGRSDSLLYPRLQSGNVNFSPKGSEGRH